MKLSEMIGPECIIPQLKATDKKGVLEELSDPLVQQNSSIDKQVLVKVLMERERLGSTGIGEGVAIPHGKLHGITRPLLAFGRSISGLDFESMDGEPAHLFFLLVAPENSAGIHLKVLARIARMLKNAGFRKDLMKAKDREQIYETILKGDHEP